MQKGTSFHIDSGYHEWNLTVDILDLCEDLQNIIHLLNDGDGDLKFEYDIPKHTGNKFPSKCIWRLGGSNNRPYHEAIDFTL